LDLQISPGCVATYCR